MRPPVACMAAGGSTVLSRAFGLSSYELDTPCATTTGKSLAYGNRGAAAAAIAECNATRVWQAWPGATVPRCHRGEGCRMHVVASPHHVDAVVSSHTSVTPGPARPPLTHCECISAL